MITCDSVQSSIVVCLSTTHASTSTPLSCLVLCTRTRPQTSSRCTRPSHVAAVRFVVSANVQARFCRCPAVCIRHLLQRATRGTHLISAVLVGAHTHLVYKHSAPVAPHANNFELAGFTSLTETKTLSKVMTCYARPSS